MKKVYFLIISLININIIFHLKNLDKENSYCKNLLFIVCDFEI